jgi:hypothetical protein
MSENLRLDTLISRHQEAKAAEAEWRTERIELELDIAALVGVNAHGQKTVRQGDFKITVKPNFSYSIDMAKWNELADKFPAELHPFKIVLDESKIRSISKNRPDLYFDLACAVSVKPTKVSVVIAPAEVAQ